MELFSTAPTEQDILLFLAVATAIILVVTALMHRRHPFSIVVFLALGVGGLYLIWRYVVPSVTRWWRHNSDTVITIAVLVVVGYLAWRYRDRIWKPAGDSTGDPPPPPEWTWPSSTMTPGLDTEVWKAVLDFKPSTVYDQETGYHVELYRHLAGRFQQVELEKRTGSSRPDISIGNRIAIEVKGPTSNGALDTVPSKIIRYGQHYGLVYVVLFRPGFSPNYFEEWQKGIQRNFPKAGVVTKP